MKPFSTHLFGILLALMAGAAQSAWAQTNVTTADALYTAVTNNQTVTLGQDITLTGGRLEIGAVTITLDLNGHTLSRSIEAAADDGQVIAVKNGGQLTVTDSSADKSGTITGGWAKMGGGILVNAGGELTIQGGTITGNTASELGGGIHNEGTTTIKGGTITGNTAGTYGGAIYSNKTLNIVNMSSGVTLSGNTAQSGGGAICTEGETTLHHVTLKGNNGGAYGGGIYMFGTGTVLLQSDCTITGNTAQTGGGIFMTADGATLKMRDKPVVKDNTYDDVYLSPYQLITLAGSLSPGASVGVFTEVQQDNFTTGYRTSMNTADPSTYFHAVSSRFAGSIGWNADNTEGKLTLTGGYKYIERAWDASAKKVTEAEKTCDSYTLISGNDTSDESGWQGLYNGWYVVTGNASRKVLNVQGNDVHLIIPDGTSLTVTCGVKVELKSNAVLNIYGQAGGTGQLIATNSYAGGAGIGSGGGSDDGNAGQINIHGGTITATGNQYGAGIGGGDSHGFGLQANNSGLTVYGGTVTAQGGEYAAGIGSGDQPGTDLAGYVTIYGGTVTAYGGKEAAGIGGGNEGNGAMFSIYGGKVTATGGYLGAGIGGGDEGRGGQSSFYGGEVSANGGENGAGIGGGENGHGGYIDIYEGNILATGGIHGAGIGGGDNSGGGTIRIHSGNSVVVATGGDAGTGAAVGGGAGIGGGREYGFLGNYNPNEHGNSGTITIEGGDVTAKSVSNAAGLGGGENSRYCNVTISGGTVTAISLDHGAGIGVGAGDIKLTADLDITISGGTITAYSKGYGAGIGTGAGTHFGHGGNSGISKGEIRITGGTVFAGDIYGEWIGAGAGIGTAGYYWIDSRHSYMQGSIIINGGKVKAGSTSGAGIGPGAGQYIEETGFISISGGQVTVTSRNASAIGKAVDEEIDTDNGKEHFLSRNEGTVVISGGKSDLNSHNSFPIVHVQDASRLQIGDELMVRKFTKFGRNERISALQGNNRWVYVEPCTHSAVDADNSCLYCLKGAISAISLADASDNSEIISGYNGKTVSVTLSGRTLWKDGAWNTLCLPFALGDSDPDDNLTFTGTPLEGATVKTLSSTAFDSKTGTLTLNFSDDDLTAIEAGKPYIVKWAAGDANIENPVFSGVTIVNTTSDVVTDELAFRGLYKPLEIGGEDRSLLYLDADNKLCYPSGAMTIGAFRCYFELGEGLTAGDPASGIRTFVLNFEGEETGIREINPSNPSNPSNFSNASNLWFTLDGQRLNGQPVHGGLYLHNGRKLLIK